VLWVCALGAACGPPEREGGDGDDDGDLRADAAPPPADAAEFIDARPVVPETPTVYAHTKDMLYRLEEGTLSPIVIGPFKAPGADPITDLAVAPEGTIYCISKHTLYTADATDGHVTKVAAIASGPMAGNVGLTTLPSGDLLATDSSGGVRRINRMNGAVMEIGSFGGGLATAGDLVAVESGTMYGISDKGPVGNEATNNWLITVDTVTGVGTPVGQIGRGKVFGAAFVDGKVLAFTANGDIIEVEPATGEGLLRKSTGLEFWGAGVSSLVPGPQ
jgi:hypothetical protein